MHIAIEITQQLNKPLFQAMMSNVNQHPEFQQVMTDYSGNKLYQTADGKPDVIKLKKEAMAKVLARVVAGIADTQERGLVTRQTVEMWNKTAEWLKSLFGKAGFDPFEEAAHQVLGNTEFKGTADDIRTDKKKFLDENKDAVNYQFRAIDKLSKNIDKIQKWEKQIKDPEILFKKLQTDLGIPKDQLALIKERYHSALKFDENQTVIKQKNRRYSSSSSKEITCNYTKSNR